MKIVTDHRVTTFATSSTSRSDQVSGIELAGIGFTRGYNKDTMACQQKSHNLKLIKWQSSSKSCLSNPVFLSAGPGDLLPCMFQMFACSNIPDSNEQLVIRLDELFIRIRCVEAGKHQKHAGQGSSAQCLIRCKTLDLRYHELPAK